MLHPRPLQREGLAARSAPFLAAIAAAFALAVLDERAPELGGVWGESVAALWTAAGLALVVGAAAVLVPWGLLPAWAQSAPPLAVIGVIALLREAEGGVPSGFGVLFLLPVFWLALYGTRAELTVALVGVGLALIAPVVLMGEPGYPVGEGRRALLTVITSALVGFAAQRLVRDARRGADEARRRTHALHERESDIATVARELSGGENARERLCRAAVEVAEARFSWLLEPDGSGNLEATAAAGIAAPPFSLALDREPLGGAALAFGSGERVFVADARGDRALSERLVRASGTVSVLFEPVMAGWVPCGVLAVGWPELVGDPAELPLSVISLLAAEAAVVIERADLEARLAAEARTDALTGLPNRRAWDEELPRELARSERYVHPVTIAMLDLDHFKRFNDEHGHLEGDRLLKEVAAAWSGELRDVDLIARYGGEEFGVIFPNSSLQEAFEAIERVRGVTPRGLTTSAGLARGRRGETPAELVARADAALYQAKRAGRDRAETAD